MNIKRYIETNEFDLIEADLCARLPYCPKFHYFHIFEDGEDEDFDDDITTYQLANFEVIGEYHSDPVSLSDIRLYLRPLSSITDDEKHDLLRYGAVNTLENGEVIDVACIGFDRHCEVQDYLNRHHFDYRGLIEKGLAIEAPDGMY